jgi:uncharacterized damage-inducible protein DinB
MEDLRYPMGQFSFPQQASTVEERREWIQQIAETPANMRAAVAGLNAEQLATPYRPGGWTVAQVVHHVPDSHLHSYIRFKFALTEDNPTIKPYDEARWAKLPDAIETPVEVSLQLLEALHSRWVRFLESLSPAEYTRSLFHPELGTVRLEQILALYAWHGRHHVGHITALRRRMSW